MITLDIKETRSGIVESNNNYGVDDLKVLAGHLREFAAARNWNQCHSPRNLAMALAGECSEVLEHFQWPTEADSAALDETKLRDVSHELADVIIYTARMADMLGVRPAAGRLREDGVN